MILDINKDLLLEGVQAKELKRDKYNPVDRYSDTELRDEEKKMEKSKKEIKLEPTKTFVKDSKDFKQLQEDSFSDQHPIMSGILNAKKKWDGMFNSAGGATGANAPAAVSDVTEPSGLAGSVSNILSRRQATDDALAMLDHS